MIVYGRLDLLRSSVWFASSVMKKPFIIMSSESVTDSSIEASGLHSASDLKVGISAFGSYMLGVGTLIGSMAWLIHGTMIERAGALPSIAAWILGAVTMLPLALVIAELASIYPFAGGPYVYKVEAFKLIMPHKDASLFGFLSGWLYWIAMMTGLAFMTNGLSDLLSQWFLKGEESSWLCFLVSFALLVLATLINLTRVSTSSRVVNLLTIFKFFMAFFFLFLVISAQGPSPDNLLHNTKASDPISFLQEMNKVLLLCAVAYSGLEVVSCTASETDGASRSVPAAILKTLFTVAAFYIFLAFAVGISMNFSGPEAALRPDQATCPAVLGVLCGPLWGSIMGAFVIVSIFSCSVGAVMSNARVSYSMAKSGVFPRVFSDVNASAGVPVYSLWFQLLFVSLIALISRLAYMNGLTGNAYAFLGEVYGVLYSFLAAMYGVSLLILRFKAPQLKRPFRIGRSGNVLAVFVSILVFLIFGYLCLFCAHWTHQLTGLILLLSGIPVYRLCCRLNLRGNHR